MGAAGFTATEEEEEDVGGYASDIEAVRGQQRRRAPGSLEEAVARDDMVLYCKHPFYRASRAEAEQVGLSPFRRGQRGGASLGLQFKVAIHPVQQYLEREFGVVDARDVGWGRLKKLKSNPISSKLLARTITKIYQEFLQFYRVPLSKHS